MANPSSDGSASALFVINAYQTAAFSTTVERMYDLGMWLRRTQAGWEEPRPRVCEACGGALGPGTVLVGVAHCRCGFLHRTHFCRE